MPRRHPFTVYQDELKRARVNARAQRGVAIKEYAARREAISTEEKRAMGEALKVYKAAEIAIRK